MEIRDEVKHVKKIKVAMKDSQLFLDEFKDVFHEEMNELSLIRDLDHTISLVVNGDIITGTLYCHFV